MESVPPQQPNTHGQGVRSEHQSMSDWLRDVASRSNQQARAMHEARGRMPGMEGSVRTNEANATRASSAPGHTIYRETIGPHGRTYQMSTVQTYMHNTGNRLREEQDLLEEARRAVNGQNPPNDPQSMLNNLHRSASSTSLYGRQLPRPGITTPLAPNSLPRRQTPESLRSGAFGNYNSAFRPPPSSQQSYPLEVYILSSPEGPRALLVNNNTSETYYTPRLQSAASHPQLRQTVLPMSMIAEVQNAQLQNQQQQPPPLGHHFTPAAANTQTGAQQPAQPLQAPAQRRDQGPAMQQAPQDAQPLNRAAAGFPPFLVQVWPHVWGMLRAGFFFWAFTNSDSFWVKWGTIVGVVILSLLMSTGALGNFATRAWRPIGQQLENILPALEQPHRQAGPAANNAGHAGAMRQDPDPAGMAQRLVAGRQDTWLPRQLRRVERASLLFLASIAPGVAERHIANLEAEARAERERLERERREAEEAAAAAAANEAEKKTDITNTEATEQSGEPSQANNEQTSTVDG